jgi:hypothetical protein
MEMPSTLAVLLQGYDAWVIREKPLCEDAARVLRALQRAAAQFRRAREPVPSIPSLLKAERFGRPTSGAFQFGTLPTDALLF